MKTIKQIRKDNLKILLGDFNTKKAFADATGIKSSYLSHLVSDKEGTKEIGQLTARRFEEKLGKEPGWMDKDNSMMQWATDATPVIDAVFDLYDILEEIGVKPEQLERSMLRQLLTTVLRNYLDSSKPDSIELKAMLFDSLLTNRAF